MGNTFIQAATETEESMNIEIANRLVNMRKSNNLSQEALAEKLGISRQAVSKWERAEASPDTDNLIMLARLYGVSLDELLKTEDEIPVASDEGQTDNASDGKEETETFTGNTSAENTYEDSEYVHVGLGGVHVKDKDGSEVHVGWDGVHVDDRKSGDGVHVDKNGVYINGEKYEDDWGGFFRHFPFALMIVIVYLVLGLIFNAWHPAWLLFLLIPLWHSFESAMRHRNANLFAYPVLAVLLFLCGGFFMGNWHPGWIIFLTIPVYYSLAGYFYHIRKRNE